MLEAAPLRTDLAPAPEGSHALWVRANDGVRLRLGVFPAETTAWGTVFLFPGRTEYIEKYALTAARFSKAGLTTLAIDWRGQGLADRLLDDPMPGHVEAFSDYQRDVQAMLETAREMGLPQPYFLLAHSMGGAIGLRALFETLPVAAAGFSGPMWGIRINPVLRPLARLIGYCAIALGRGQKIAPGAGDGNYVLKEPFENNMLTTDPEMYAMMGDHIRAEARFGLAGPTSTWVITALQDGNELARLPAPDLPCLTFLGTNERIVDTDRIKQRMSGWSNGRLEMVAGGEHEVLMEPPEIRDKVMADLIALYQSAA